MRLTARGILYNRQLNKILFLKYLDLESESTKAFSDGFWVMPGGGVEQDETFEQALKRELYEETGIAETDIKECAFSRIVSLNLNVNESILCYERYYFIETNAVTVHQDHATDLEKETIKEYKWWSVDELK